MLGLISFKNEITRSYIKIWLPALEVYLIVHRDFGCWFYNPVNKKASQPKPFNKITPLELKQVIDADAVVVQEMFKIFYREVFENFPIFEVVREHSNNEIVKDENARMRVFLTAASTLVEKPCSLAMKGPPSIGKTFLLTRMTRYFPPEMVFVLSGASAKSFYYNDTKLIDPETNEEIVKPRKEDYEDKDSYKEALKEYKEKRKRAIRVRDFKYNILIFLDLSPEQVSPSLKTLLSHDSKESWYQTVEKLKGMKVLLREWPSALFATANKKIDREMGTRYILDQPEINEEKLQKILEKTEKNHQIPRLNGKCDHIVEVVREYIRYIKENYSKKKVVIPYKTSHIFKKYNEMRVVRDYDRFIALVETIAMLQAPKRPRILIEKFGEVEEYIVATKEDVELALELIDDIIESSLSGIPRDVLDFYYNILLPEVKDKTIELLSYEQILDAYYLKTGKSVSRKLIREEYIKPLLKAEWLQEEPDPEDKRRKLFRPLVKERIEKISSEVELDGIDDWWREYKENIRNAVRELSSLGQHVEIKLTVIGAQDEKMFLDLLKNSIKVNSNFLPIFFVNLFDNKIQEQSINKTEKNGVPHSPIFQEEQRKEKELSGLNVPNVSRRENNENLKILDNSLLKEKNGRIREPVFSSSNDSDNKKQRLNKAGKNIGRKIKLTFNNLDYNVAEEDGFVHYVCKKCGSYFATIDDLEAHSKTCQGGENC